MTLEAIKFRADESIIDMPKDLQSLKGKVTNLSLFGKELDDTIYLSDEKYRVAILFEKVKIGVHYNYQNRNGACYIEIAFNGALTKGNYTDAELQICITPTNNTLDNNFSSTKSTITKEINQIKEENYLKLKQTNS